MAIVARELSKDEFPLAEKVWYYYHQQKADPTADRIFGVFFNETLVGVARCKRHKDGLEVDGVFVLEEHRGFGYAGLAIRELIKGCGQEVLYMHSTLPLVVFYQTFAFVPIPEDELPPTIKERLNFCFGDMEGCNARPMKRVPG